MKKYGFLLTLFLCTYLSAQETKVETTTQDISYTASQDAYAQARCKLDVYYPAGLTDAPTVVWFHGGGLTSGSKFIPEQLKKSGMIVIGVNYRLLPKAPVDSCLDDAAAAVAWAFHNVRKYGGDPQKIFVSGHSAGGYLTAMIGLDKQWLRKYDIDADSIAGLIPFSGQVVSHYAYRQMHDIGALQPTIDRYAPLFHVRKDAPPLVLITGDCNLELYGRYEENAYLWRMMQLAGHPETSLYELGGYDHGAMAEPAFHILLNHLRSILREREEQAAAKLALPRATPQSERVDAAGLERFLEKAKDAKLEVHSLMVVRHGKVVFERWNEGHSPTEPHVMHSVSKTFTATAVGFAVSEGLLKVSDKVISFFPDKLPAQVSDNLRAMTVKDLLTMNAGSDEAEVGKIMRQQGQDWVTAFLSVPVIHQPGTFYDYSSLSTYMLSAIVQKLTGQKIVDYLTPRLFRPLGIIKPRWQESPQGINTGGWGLYVRTEDMAKLGQLFLQKGMWNGKQLLPEAWIEEASARQVPSLPAGSKKETLTPEQKKGDYTRGYGYQMWRCPYNGYRADGANGQFIIILPDKDAVIVLTSNVRDMQAELNLVWENIYPAIKR
ncbi:MAG: serine hydrolase [Prevotellaceae bacterium]|jgi:CubicO group peptidase (beta-lactamase class C family)|nr:serine hydrolase [Prevotellaceae bacterium]